MGVCLRGCLGSSGVVGLGICQVAIGYRDRWIKTGRESWGWGWAPSSAESGHLEVVEQVDEFRGEQEIGSGIEVKWV